MKRFLLSPRTLAFTFLLLGLSSGYLIGFHRGAHSVGSTAYSRLLTPTEAHELLSHKVSESYDRTVNAPSGGTLIR